MLQTRNPVGLSTRQFRSRGKLFFRAMGISVFLGGVCGFGILCLAFIVHLLSGMPGHFVVWGAAIGAGLSLISSFLFMTFTRQGWLFAARNQKLADEGAELALRTGVEFGARTLDGAGEVVCAVGDAAGDIDVSL